MRNPFKKVLLILIPAAFLATACSEAPQKQSSATEAVPPQEQQAGNQAAGVELSRREAKFPAVNLDGTFIIDAAENLRRAYLHWTPHTRIAAGVAVESEDFDAKTDLPAVETLLVPAQIGYFAPNGFYGTVGATLVHQDVEDQGEDEFVLFDATLGYRLPRRYGVVRVVLG